MRRATEIDPTYAPSFWRLGLWLLDLESARGGGARVQPRDRDRSLRIGPAGLASLASTFSATRTPGRRGCSNSSRRPARPTATSCSFSALPYRRLGRADEAASALAVGAKGEPQWSDPWTDEMAGFRRGYAALLKDATSYVIAGQFDQATRILEQLRRDETRRHRADGASWPGVRRRGPRRRRGLAARAGGCEATRSLRGVRGSGDGLHASEPAVEGARRRRSRGLAQPVVRARIRDAGAGAVAKRRSAWRRAAFDTSVRLDPRNAGRWCGWGWSRPISIAPKDAHDRIRTRHAGRSDQRRCLDRYRQCRAARCATSMRHPRR